VAALHKGADWKGWSLTTRLGKAMILAMELLSFRHKAMILAPVF
jgi:hypothetical protein